MNENTTKLIEQLAAKLGTTSEFIWNILLKQAPIAGIKGIISILLSISLCFTIYRLHIFFLKKKDTDGMTIYDNYAEGAVFPMLLGALVAIVIFLVSFGSIGDVYDAFLNPQYWALKHILKEIKQ